MPKYNQTKHNIFLSIILVIVKCPFLFLKIVFHEFLIYIYIYIYLYLLIWRNSI